MRSSLLTFCSALATSIPLFAAGAGLALGPGGEPQLETTGKVGEQLTIDASSELNAGWEALRSMILTNSSVRFSDLWCGTAQKRFYRVTRSAAGEAPIAPNFRLLDQQGKARELYYYWGAEEIKSFVLIFTQNGCAEIEAQLPAIAALRKDFESKGVVFWMVNSQAGASRKSIASEASKLGINFPVLHDRAQTVARLYKSAVASEVICVDRASLSVFYRGAIDDRLTATSGVPGQMYLREALAAHLDGQEYAIRQTKPPGCDQPLKTLSLSYSQDIAPILQAKCINCHSPGNVAPWAMTNHEVVVQYRALMLEKISSKEMPPWHADPEYGYFKNDISLTGDEEQKLVQWLADGAPRGGGPDPLATPAPPVPKWPAELGEPDLILRAPEQRIKAEGVEPYRYIFIDTGLTNDAWIKAAIVRPSNPKVVHHYLVWEGASMFQMAVGLAGYVPGTQRGAYPDGSGVLLHGDTPLTFNLHYTPSGEEETDQPELALWFHKTPPAKSLITLPIFNLKLNIPAGARESETTATPFFGPSLPHSGTLYSLSPHMHFRGKRMKFDVIYPDNSRETLLSVPNYDFRWQATYQLTEPKKIPAGSKIVVSGAFDNSTLNPYNPDPKSNVQWGEQSWEEMFIGYFDFTQDD